VNIALDQSGVTLSMNLQLLTNMTSLPQAQLQLPVSNASQVIQPLQKAIQKLVPKAQVQQVSLKAKIGNLTSQLSILEENYTVAITGTNTNTGGLVNATLAFLSLNSSDAIRLGGVELNNVGAAYLLGPIQSYGTTSGRYRFYFDQSIYLNSIIPGQTTQTFNMLDFSWVPKISEWTHQYQPLDSSSKWDYVSTPYNLTIGLLTPEGLLYHPVKTYYQCSLELVAPPRAWAKGTNVYFNTTTTTDYVLPLIVVVPLATAIGTFVLDRRLTRQTRTRKKKR
jgi:hypothetical protein